MRVYTVADNAASQGDRPHVDRHGDCHVVNGARAPNWRRVWVAVGSDRLRCPDGHTIKDPHVWESGGLRCWHKTSNGVECGKLIYLVGGGLVNPRGLPLVIVAEVTPEELKRMAAERMDHDRALEFLGIRF